MYRKNVAGQNLPFCLVNASSGAALTGAVVTARRSIDGGAQVAATGSVVELGSGQYNLALSQADTNGNNIGLLLTAPSAIPVHFTLVTTAADPTDAVRFGLTALPNAGAGANAGLATVDANNAVKIQAGIGANQISLAAGAVTVGTNNDKMGYSLAGNAVDAAQFTQAAADKVWSSATRTLTSLSALVASIAAAVWVNVTRTLTMTAAQIAAVISGTNIVVQRGDSLSVSFTGLGSLTGRSKLWFTVKHTLGDADAAAIVQIEETAGLLTLNGAPATSGQGSLTVTDATTGALTITLAAVATATLGPAFSSSYDVQIAVGGTITTLTQGSLAVNGDVTRAVS